jgi:hypothetical protein
VLNRQRFEVRAIDNVGAVDPEPAQKVFYTRQSFVPEPSIASPQTGASFFVLDAVTDWWQGIPLQYTATDEDGEVVEYAWAVNDGDWVWTRDTTVFIPPDKFGPSLEGEHTIRVTARDNTNLVNTEGASVTVRLVRPEFSKRLLIVDQTNAANFHSGVGATDEDVATFYSDLFGYSDGSVWDVWDYRRRGMPPREIIGQYRTVVWHADDKPTSAPHALVREIGHVQDYLNVGGNIVMSGWRVLKSFAWQESFPQTFSEGTFVNDYMQIVNVDETPLFADMTGMVGVGGFTDVRVDASKLQYFPNNGTLNNINIIQQRGGFTEVIGSYVASDDTRFPQYRGSPVGLIYFGTSFNAAVLGFPLFFIEKEDARVLARQIMERIERNG